MLRAQKLRAEWTRDLAAWQLIMQTAWNEALQRFIAAVHATDGQPIRTWRELADLWVSTANDTLTQTHRTPDSSKRSVASRDRPPSAVSRSGRSWKRIARCTTSRRAPEVDDLSRAVYELRRELRALRREARVASRGCQARRRASERTR
jgi:hypothetical protein